MNLFPFWISFSYEENSDRKTYCRSCAVFGAELQMNCISPEITVKTVKNNILKYSLLYEMHNKII